MLQDIYPNKLINQYDPAKEPDSDSRIMIFRGRELLCCIDRELDFPKFIDFQGIKVQYLFSVDQEDYFMPVNIADVTDEHLTDIEAQGYTFQELSDIREAEPCPKYRVYAAYTVKHLWDWYRDVKFCGRCGKPMIHSETERAMCCKSCGYIAYPRIMPAVIVGVINGDRLLLTRYRTGYNHNALIAGFTEIGETLEETVEREVMEEAEIHVKDITYYKSQPWGIAGDILVGYYCHVDGDDTITMDSSELKYAEWVKREDIVLQPDESSLTNEMMQKFKLGEIKLI